MINRAYTSVSLSINNVVTRALATNTELIITKNTLSRISALMTVIVHNVFVRCAHNALLLWCVPAAFRALANSIYARFIRWFASSANTGLFGASLTTVGAIIALFVELVLIGITFIG